MEFKKLTDEEVAQLTPEEFIVYQEKLLIYLDEKNKLDWNSKTLEAKENEVLSDLSFMIARGDPASLYQFEMILDTALAENFNEELISRTVGSQYAKTAKLIRERITSNEKFTFFWETRSPFSQWYKAKFIGTTFMLFDHPSLFYKRESLLNGLFPIDQQEYTSAEQFMMYHKAMIFFDRQVAKQIMETSDPRGIKDLGRQVKRYDDDIWKYFRSKIVYEGNKAKFSQNAELQMPLFSTAGTTLVEAAPNDSIWGIGLAADNPSAKNRKTWKGKNLLGEILTQIRDELMEESGISADYFIDQTNV